MMLIILTTHPIQYQVPIWQALAKDNAMPFEVWYLTKHGVNESFDVQFNKSFSWDLNLLEGYPHRFLKVNENAAPNKGFGNLRLKENLVPLLNEKGAKAILINGWQVLAYWQAVWQAHKAGVQVWLRAETNDIKPISPYKEPLRRILLHQFFKRISYFLFIGQANQRFYLSHGLKKKQLVPGHYCIDNDRFKEQADKIAGERDKIRAGWQIQPEAICLLFSGKLINKKRPMELVRAARNWKGERPLHLLFMGSGALADELKQACNVVFDEGKKVNEKSTSVKASFLGFVNQKELTKGYIAADALVLPSNYGETWGLVVNEAMACGLPAIVSDQVGCAEDLVAPVDPLLVFKCDDIESLIRAIRDFEKHSDEMNNLRLRVQKQVEKYHLRVTVNSIHELYKRIE